MVTPLKYFSGNSNICVLLGLASADCLILLKLRCFWFLVCRVIFLLYPGYFWYYVMRLWILFKSVWQALSDIMLEGK